MSEFDPFARHKGEKEPEDRPKPETVAGPEWVQKRLLYWIQNNWGKRTITARQIYTYGPVNVRDWNSAIGTAEKLAERGWLSPLKTRRHDARKWEIVRERPEFDTATIR